MNWPSIFIVGFGVPLVLFWIFLFWWNRQGPYRTGRDVSTGNFQGRLSSEHKNWFINGLVFVTALAFIGFFALYGYLRFKHGANTPTVLLVINIWFWFNGLIVAALYFHLKKQPNESPEKLLRLKENFRKLFLIYGGFCIFVLLTSIWIAS